MLPVQQEPDDFSVLAVTLKKENYCINHIQLLAGFNSHINTFYGCIIFFFLWGSLAISGTGNIIK